MEQRLGSILDRAEKQMSASTRSKVRQVDGKLPRGNLRCKRDSFTTDLTGFLLKHKAAGSDSRVVEEEELIKDAQILAMRNFLVT